MKRILNIALVAGACALPLLALQNGPELRSALARLERSIQHLGTLEERTQSGDPTVIAEVLACTEAPLSDPQAAEERLVSLRQELAQLQWELEESHAGAVAVAREPEGEEASQGAWSSGLDDAQRRALALPPEGRRQAPVLAREPAKAFEADAYTADAVRLARVHYRQGLYREGLALLDGRELDLPAAYWKARCLEKLGRLGEARVLYEHVATTGGESFEALRAREDIQFLTWRERFDANAKRAGGGQ